MRPILTIVVASGLAASALGQISFTDETVLADGFWNNPTSTRIDDSGVVHLAFMKQFDTDSSTKDIWYANDAGGTWSFTQITNDGVRQEFPDLTLDAAGNVHIAFHTGTGSSNKIQYTNNIGGSFFPAVDITGSGFIIVDHAIDSAGVAHFTFTNQDLSGQEDVYYRSYDPATMTLGPLVNLSNTPGRDEYYPQLAIGPDDVVHIVWYAQSIFGGPLVYMNNASGTFQPVSTGVGAAAEDPMITVGPDGKVSISYDAGDMLWLIEDAAGDGNFTSPLLLLNASYRPAFYDNMALDAAGNRYIPFVSNVGDLEGTYLLVEQSGVFGAPVVIDESPSGNQGISVAINASGAIVASWQTSGVANGNVFANIYLSRGQIGGGCAGDLTGDSVVDFDDFSQIASCWGQPCGDLTGDGLTNFDDFAVLASDWNCGL